MGETKTRFTCDTIYINDLKIYCKTCIFYEKRVNIYS